MAARLPQRPVHCPKGHGPKAGQRTGVLSTVGQRSPWAGLDVLHLSSEPWKNMCLHLCEALRTGQPSLQPRTPTRTHAAATGSPEAEARVGRAEAGQRQGGGWRRLRTMGPRAGPPVPRLPAGLQESQPLSVVLSFSGQVGQDLVPSYTTHINLGCTLKGFCPGGYHPQSGDPGEKEPAGAWRGLWRPWTAGMGRKAGFLGCRGSALGTEVMKMPLAGGGQRGAYRCRDDEVEYGPSFHSTLVHSESRCRVWI